MSVSEKAKMLVACGFVELVQKLWRRYLSPQLLEKNDDLPNYIFMSMDVICSFLATVIVVR